MSAAGRAADGRNQGGATGKITLEVREDAAGWWKWDGRVGGGRGDRWVGRAVGVGDGGEGSSQIWAKGQV